MRGYAGVDLRDAKWISAGGKCTAPLIRGKIWVPEVKSASITIAGLGYFEVYINGKKVSEDLYLPLSTDYHERTGIIYCGYPFEEKLRHRLYCPVYDIMPYLTEGMNTICFMMGPGWYGDVKQGYGIVKICYLIAYRM